MFSSVSIPRFLRTRPLRGHHLKGGRVPRPHQGGVPFGVPWKHPGGWQVARCRLFPWSHPEAATREGWWLSTINTPAGRAAIEELAVGDLVICQRTDPIRGDGTLVGICVIGMKDAWDDADTGGRESQACLIPLAKFTHPVPRRTAYRHGRLRVKSLSAGQQLPGRRGPIGFGLSYVEWDDAVELLSVCGIPPEALAEPDTARLAARLSLDPPIDMVRAASRGRMVARGVV